MRIYRATNSDVPLIIECAREFCAALDQDLDEQNYRSFWESSIDNGAIFLLESDGAVAGGIGGLKSIDPLSGKPIAIEMFWYVKEQYRSGLWPIRLLHEFERWAEEAGCHSINMIHMERSMPEHLKRIYFRGGYELIETVHQKRIVKGVVIV